MPGFWHAHPSIGAGQVDPILTTFFPPLKAVVQIVAIVPVVFCMDKGALALSACGQGGYISEKMSSIANKLHLIFVDHNLCQLFEKAVLCPTRNLAKKGVLWRGEDKKEGRRLIAKVCRDSLQRRQPFIPLDNEQINQLQKAPCETFQSGICTGASLWMAKQLLRAKPKNELELIRCISSCREGFPAEAAGLHELERGLKFATKSLSSRQQAFLDGLLECSKEELHKWAKNEQKSEEQTALLWAAKKREKEIECRFLFASNRYWIMASAADLTVESFNKPSPRFFPHLATNLNGQDEFNRLPNGCYNLFFAQHTIVYLKKSFGSYVVDPDIGLFKCSNAKELCEHIAPYGNEANLTAYRYMQKGQSAND